MNPIRTSFALALVMSVAGCDSGPTLDVTAEPAGANCPAGGLRIEADGEVFYSCNGHATTESVAAGAPGNPCVGDALRVTIPLEDGTTRHAYVCESVPQDPVVTGYFTQSFESMISARRVQCTCTVDPQDQANCQAEVQVFESLVPVLTACVGESIAAAGPFPTADRPALECFVNAAAARNECLDAIPASACTMDLAMAEQACELLGSTTACAAPSADFDAWNDRVDLLLQLFDCTRFAT